VRTPVSLRLKGCELQEASKSAALAASEITKKEGPPTILAVCMRIKSIPQEAKYTITNSPLVFHKPEFSAKCRYSLIFQVFL
jgi:hypothetical protein